MRGLPGEFADLRPAELRALAQTLADMADECEAQATLGVGRRLWQERPVRQRQ